MQLRMFTTNNNSNKCQFPFPFKIPTQKKEVKIKLEDEVRILSYLKDTKLGIKVIIF